MYATYIEKVAMMIIFPCFLCLIFDKITHDELFIQGTHARFKPYLDKDDLEWAEELGASWYKVKERVQINAPFNSGGPLGNKKWPLNEEWRITVGAIIFDFFLKLEFLKHH